MTIVHNLTWAKMKDLLDNGWAFSYETLDSDRYYILTFINGEEYSTILFFTQTSDKTDFDTNYASLASTDINELVGSQNAHVFKTEALVDGVYEDSKVIVCHHSAKTLNIENKHATGGLKYKVWGSPNRSEWELVVTETALAALTKTSVTNTDYWKFVKLSAKGDGAASTIDAFIQVGQ